MAAPPTEHEILDVNRRYHDVAAESYDSKWGISFGEIGHQQVLGKIAKLLGPRPGTAKCGDRAHDQHHGSQHDRRSLDALVAVVKPRCSRDRTSSVHCGSQVCTRLVRDP